MILLSRLLLQSTPQHDVQDAALALKKVFRVNSSWTDDCIRTVSFLQSQSTSSLDFLLLGTSKIINT